MSRVDAQAQLVGKYGTFRQPFDLSSLRLLAACICITTRVQLNEFRTQISARLDLRLIRIDEHAHRDPRFVETHNSFLQTRERATDIESTFRRNLRPFLRNEARLIGLHFLSERDD